MVFLNSGKTAVRNWLAGSSSTAPSRMLWSNETTSVNLTDSTVSALLGKSFLSTDISIERQVKWEGIVLTTELTTSTIGKIGIGTETTGTAGTLYLLENVNPISKTNQFDLQTLMVLEVE